VAAAQAASTNETLLEASAAVANELLVGIHDYLLSLLEIYTGVEHLVLVGDDRFIPFARLPDNAALLLESAYPGGGDLSPGGTSVGQALAADRYLSDDPMAVLAGFTAGDLSTNLFLPDLTVGRLVETPAEIVATIATYISTEGILDLGPQADATLHKVQVTGYDFLVDSATAIRERWKTRLGVATPEGSLQPVDGSLVADAWPQPRDDELFDHLTGNGGEPYGVINLNGHANHYQEGVPGADPHDIVGLDAVHLYGPDGCAASNGPVDLPGSVVYSVGCHSGLPVPGSCSTDGEHSLDLAQSFLSRGVQAYLGNTGYGWGLVHGIGYGERVVELFTEELTMGGTQTVGELYRRTKQRYVLETARFDSYDAKSLMQWTLYGLPMYEVKTGIVVEDKRVFTKAAPAMDQVGPELRLGKLRAKQQVGTIDKALPAYLTRLEMHWDLTAAGVYQKKTAAGVVIDPAVAGCPDPDGCYYTLNDLVERGTGATDLPIQPYFVFDSRLAGTSQHGVLWMGGVYDEESGWVPVFGELASNGGDFSDHGAAPRVGISHPTGARVIGGSDLSSCRLSDQELNSLVVTTGELVKPEESSPEYSIERLYRGVDVEVLYYNNSATGAGNCDRQGPAFDPGPYGGEYHQLADGVVTWAVPVTDAGGIWRVVVVATDNTVDGSGQGRWAPYDLVNDGTGTWRGTLDMTGVTRLTYVVQAVDNRGNVSWLEYQTTELPASGVDTGLPLPVDVEDWLIFSDGFESGNASRWSSPY